MKKKSYYKGVQKIKKTPKKKVKKKKCCG